MDYSIIGRIVRDLALSVRLVTKDGEIHGWSSWLISPTPGYLESASGGPYPLAEIEAFVIDPVAITQSGSRLPVHSIDKAVVLEERLSAAGISFAREPDGCVHVRPAANEAV